MAPRQTSDERREQVLDAAVREFAERGYHAASTAAIAKRAGISQPYIYALFPSKLDLFLAVHDRAVAGIRDAFSAAAHGAEGPDEALRAMGRAYKDLIGDRHLLQCQLQSYAAAGDPEIRPHVSAAFRDLFEHVCRISGADAGRVAEFIACGMLINVASALELPRLIEALTGEGGALAAVAAVD